MEKGEFMTFLGPSGSGKSTTLYILSGLEDPTQGDILVNGQTILDTPSNHRNIGMVFQRYTLFPHLSVGKNIAFPLQVRKTPKAQIAKRVKEVLKLTQLQGFEDRMPEHMSGGQQQRVALARALAYNPNILLMDEPLSALDKKLKEELQYEIRRIHQETGVTILYVTHDQQEALRLSDRIAVFNKGRIEQIGTGEQLYYQPKSKFVADFIGNSDFITCQIVSVDNGIAHISFADGTQCKNIPIHGDIQKTQTAKILLRPERIRLESTKQKHSLNIAIIIEQFIFLGTTIDVTAKTQWGESIHIRLPYGHPFIEKLKIGDTAYATSKSTETCVFADI